MKRGRNNSPKKDADKRSKTSDSAYIIHNFRENEHPIVSPSEFIRKPPRPSVFSPNLTHGLGSGVYGVVIKGNANRNIFTRHRPLNKYTTTPLSLNNPVIIDTDDESSDITQLSVYLISRCKPRISGGQLSSLIIDRNEAEEIRNRICPDSNAIEDSIEAFLGAYDDANPGDLMSQPINYLLQPHYDGIYDISRGGNQFGRGSVYFSMNLTIHSPRNQKQAFGSSKQYLEEGQKLITINGGRKLKLNRKCPLKKANMFKLNIIKKGLDKKKWICKERKNGVKYWKQLL